MQQHPNQEESRLSKLILATETGTSLGFVGPGGYPGRYSREIPPEQTLGIYFRKIPPGDTPGRYPLEILPGGVIGDVLTFRQGQVTILQVTSSYRNRHKVDQ